MSDRIISMPANDAYRENWSRIFEPKPTPKQAEAELLRQEIERQERAKHANDLARRLSNLKRTEMENEPEDGSE